MKRTCAHFILFILLSAFIGAESSFALNPDFYRQKKIKKELDLQRERGGKSLAGKRKRRVTKKKKEAKNFSKVRRRMELARVKREKLLEQDSKNKEKFRNRKVNQALKSAKRRRKKSQIGWKEESLEYDIPTPKMNKAN